MVSAMLRAGEGSIQCDASLILARLGLRECLGAGNVRNGHGASQQRVCVLSGRVRTREETRRREGDTSVL
jgi:hypothetical protein